MPGVGIDLGTALADADANLGADLITDDLAPAPDRALVDRFISDTAGAFEAVVAVYAHRMTRLAHRLLGWHGRSDVEDVVQDVFFAAFQHRHRFRGRASLSTWLTRLEQVEGWVNPWMSTISRRDQGGSIYTFSSGVDLTPDVLTERGRRTLDAG